MTPEDLKSLVAFLANQAFVKYWLHYNYPQEPPLMAIAVIGNKDLSLLDADLIDRGFAVEPNEQFNIWTIERKEEKLHV